MHRPTDAQIRAEQLIADAIVDDIKPLLTGKGPAVQGSVVCELLALYIASHHPDLRGQIMQATVKYAEYLVARWDKHVAPLDPWTMPTTDTDIN